MKRLGLRLHADEEHWIPLSDMMTGLMFLFLLIAIAYVVQVKTQQTPTALKQQKTATALLEELQKPTVSNMPPLVARPLPPYSSWAAPMIGKALHAYFPKTSTNCIGYLDGILLKYVWQRRSGGKLFGWGYDTASRAAVSRVLFATSDGIIAGAADGGYERPDVPATLAQVQSQTTGWEGYVNVTWRSVAAWAIMTQPRTICRLPPSRRASGEVL